MPTADRFLEFIHLPSYVQSAKGLLTDREQMSLELELSKNPVAGSVVVGSGGVRKVRLALPGGGKSGGARVIYYYRPARGRVYLIFAYAKNVQETISAADRNAMRKLTGMLDKEG
ncbi:MAG: type II toxin-antitoxin system RelE/ParE family toxin [Gemmatimonadaceae bacterium]